MSSSFERALRRASLLVALCSAGCASSRETAQVTPLTPLRSCPVDCRGSIGTELAERAATPAADDGASTPFTADVRLARLPAPIVDRLVGRNAWGHAIVVASDELERALRGGEVAGAARSLATTDGSVGVVADEQKRSYVSSFDFSATDDAAIADPVVGTYVIGFRLSVVPRRAELEDAWKLDVALESAEPNARDARASIDLLEAGHPVEFDVPVVACVTTTTAAQLRPGEALVVVSPELLRGDEVLLAAVSPRTAPHD